MTAPRLARSGFWCHFRSYPRTLPRPAASFQPHGSNSKLAQNRFASYKYFNRDTRQSQYNHRFRAVSLAHYIWDKYKIAIVTVVGGSALVWVYNQEAVPVTGRRRFNMISLSMEKRFSERFKSQILAQLDEPILPSDHPYTKLVVNVVERLLPSVYHLAGAGAGSGDAWRVHVIDSEDMNAFVIPGGDVFVFAGLLPICHDEEGLAVVLAHEMAHNVARHSAERMSQVIYLVPFIWAATRLLDLSDEVLFALASFTFLLPSSRTQELEADYIGLLLMAQSCFNPEAAVPFWERMKEAQRTVPLRFLSEHPLEIISTHPSNYSRIKSIKEWLPEAKDKFHQRGCGLTSNYARKIDDAFKAQGGMGRKREVVVRPQGQPQDEDDFFW
jgi:metalloendopeptidase OMA1, mitochondrial